VDRHCESLAHFGGLPLQPVNKLWTGCSCLPFAKGCRLPLRVQYARGLSLWWFEACCGFVPWGCGGRKGLKLQPVCVWPAADCCWPWLCSADWVEGTPCVVQQQAPAGPPADLCCRQQGFAGCYAVGGVVHGFAGLEIQSSSHACLPLTQQDSLSAT